MLAGQLIAVYRFGVVASNFAFLIVSCTSAMNPSSASLLRIPALLLYKDELILH
jgi:hypothetical protein